MLIIARTYIGRLSGAFDRRELALPRGFVLGNIFYSLARFFVLSSEGA